MIWVERLRVTSLRRRMRSNLSLRLLSPAVIAIAFSMAGAMLPEARAADSNLVFVLDGSGSMWGRIQGDKMKITAAKAVMSELLRDVPGNVDIAFVAYGHRRKGDCTDIETIAELGSAPASIAEAVRAITPTGKTPITDALGHAATLLGETERASTVVLVSDGIETCRGDPCALAEELTRGGVNLIIHTVGFDVGEEALEQLQCVAEAGGGNFYRADSSEELRKALFAVRTAVARQEPAPALPASPEPTETATKTKTIRKIGPATIRLDPASWVDMPPYTWKIVDPESGEEAGETREATLRVRAGEYQIVWRQSQLNHQEVPLNVIISVGPGETIEVPIDTGLRLVVPNGVEPPYSWSLQRPGDETEVAEVSRTLAPQVVPAGTYHLVWRQDQLTSSDVDLGTIEIEAGKLNEIVLDHGIQVAAAGWVPGEPYQYELLDADGDAVGEWQRFGLQLAPPGTYQLSYRQSQLGHSSCTWGMVTVPEHAFANVPINSGVRFAVADGTPLPYQVYFVNLETDEECSWGGAQREQWEAIPLPPGRYRLDWRDKQFGGSRMTLLDEFTIEPGTLVEFEM